MDELTRYLSFCESDSAKNICAPLYQLGLKGFFYIKLYEDGTFVDVSTNLEWAEYHLRNFYSCKYSILDFKENYFTDGISLWELNKSNTIWLEGKEIFRVGNGLSMSMPNENKYTENIFSMLPQIIIKSMNYI